MSSIQLGLRIENFSYVDVHREKVFAMGRLKCMEGLYSGSGEGALRMVFDRFIFSPETSLTKIYFNFSFFFFLPVLCSLVLFRRKRRVTMLLVTQLKGQTPRSRVSCSAAPRVDSRCVAAGVQGSEEAPQPGLCSRGATVTHAPCPASGTRGRDPAGHARPQTQKLVSGCVNARVSGPAGL